MSKKSHVATAVVSMAGITVLYAYAARDLARFVIKEIATDMYEHFDPEEQAQAKLLVRRLRQISETKRPSSYVANQIGDWFAKRPN